MDKSLCFSFCLRKNWRIHSVLYFGNCMWWTAHPNYDKIKKELQKYEFCDKDTKEAAISCEYTIPALYKR